MLQWRQPAPAAESLRQRALALSDVVKVFRFQAGQPVERPFASL